MSASENQIVVYQPNDTVRLDVRLENETVWLTQELAKRGRGVKVELVTHSNGELDGNES